MAKKIYSIGYGNRKIEQFTELLKKYEINLLLDIRSNPASRFQPSFNKKALVESLRSSQIDYLFMGTQLGGKPKEESLYSNGILDYDKVNTWPEYQNGIVTLINLLDQGFKICIMCAELNPEECHRKNLVSETLYLKDIETEHIMKEGTLFSHSASKNSKLF
jgi:uncharacterized protein (DUF488 family)